MDGLFINIGDRKIPLRFRMNQFEEMEEEIGYIADDIRLLVTFAPAPAYSEEVTSIFVATGLKKTNINRDPDEFLGVERYSIRDVVNMIKTGVIIDGKTIAGVMAYSYSA